MATAKETIQRKGTAETVIDVHECSYMQRPKGNATNKTGLCKFARE